MLQNYAVDGFENWPHLAFFIQRRPNFSNYFSKFCASEVASWKHSCLNFGLLVNFCRYWVVGLVKILKFVFDELSVAKSEFVTLWLYIYSKNVLFYVWLTHCEFVKVSKAISLCLKMYLGWGGIWFMAGLAQSRKKNSTILILTTPVV